MGGQMWAFHCQFSAEQPWSDKKMRKIKDDYKWQTLINISISYLLK